MRTNYFSKKLLRAACVLTLCCFTLGVSRSFGQCSSESTLTSAYCNYAPCSTSSGGSAGVFMCLSTDLAGLNLTDPTNCDGSGTCTADHCQFVHLRNLTDCGNYIWKIVITIAPHNTNTQFVICNPVTQFGSNQGGNNWSAPWTIKDITIPGTPTTITSGACNGFAGATSRNIEFDLPATGCFYMVQTCYHWTTIICGADITNIELFWIGTSGGGCGTAVTPASTNFANPTVNATSCPDAGSNYSWPGC